MGDALQDNPTSRIDERDTMFARMARRPGTPACEDYYARRSDLRAVDDRLRELPRLCSPGGRHYDREVCREAQEWFQRIDAIEPDPKVVREWSDRIASSDRPAAVLKEMALSLGAVAAGCTGVGPAFVYTHKGRFDEDYGREPPLDHGHCLVFLVEMDFEAMQGAPKASVIRESARQYYRAAHISLQVEAALRAAGHTARAQYDAHYETILPPLAVRSGLGELGRHNILIADRFGTRVRIGAVTTSLTLEHDRQRSLGAFRFCGLCRKCAENCPSHALSTGEPEEVRGVVKWPTHVERCYAYWRSVGTDCGICMSCCPFSHRDSAFHNLVRWTVRRLGWANRFYLWCDDLVYGRTWKPRA